jgi:hypothetical protein
MKGMTNERWPRYVAAFLGFVWFLEIGGGPTLNPTHVDLLLSGDWMQHWFGWLMFRHEPWTFPLGTLSAMPYPVGTTIGFTDSNPLVSLLLKPFSGLLPAEFQFIGPWLAFCFVMQGYMGAALTSAVTKDPVQQLFGGALFVLSPVLVARIGHDTLCAHWLLLGLLYLGLRDYEDPARATRASWLAAGAATLSASIHPYLAAMCWVLSQAALVRLWRAGLLTSGRTAIGAVATTVGMLLVFGAIGYLGGGAPIAAGGFGVFSADLLTFVNPDQFSRMFTGFRLPSAQWEGLAFLGLGGVLAAAAAIVVLVRQRPSLRAGTWVVIVAGVLMGVYALSWNITAAGHTVARASWLYDSLSIVTGPFRASGRFIWPAHYLLLLFGIWGASRLTRSSRPSAATAVLAVLVLLQATDLRMDSLFTAQKKLRPVPFDDFKLALGHYRHLAVYPMQVMGACGGTYDETHVYRYMLHAYRMKTTYNSGIYARLPTGLVAEACAQLDRDVMAGTLDAQTIYVVAPSSVPTFKAAGAACGRFDGDWICVSRDSDEVFRTYVDTGRVIAR